MSQPRLGDVLDELFAVIEERRGADPEASYTARLLGGNEDGLLKKIAEESGEVIMAAKDARSPTTCATRWATWSTTCSWCSRATG